MLDEAPLFANLKASDLDAAIAFYSGRDGNLPRRHAERRTDEGGGF